MPQVAGKSVTAPLGQTPTMPAAVRSRSVKTPPIASDRAARRGRFSRILTALCACGLVLLSGCERTDSVQRGYRGTGTIQYYTPSQVAAAAKLNEILRRS